MLNINKNDMNNYENVVNLIKLLNENKDNTSFDYQKEATKLMSYIREIPNKRIKNITDEKFYDLIVIGYIGKNNKNSAIWLCECICGNFTITTSINLRNGHVKSCGCRSLRLLLERNKNNTYGQKHGLSRDRIYKIFLGMKDRCHNENNPRYKNYGGRGIIICDEWLNKENGFIDFYNWAINNGYEEHLTIERKNVNGNYCPENCTWITNQEQQNNRTNNVWITVDGETLNMRQWSKVTGINEKTIEHRRRLHWNMDKLLNPVFKGKLSLEKKEEIIKLFYSGKHSQRKIAQLFNVSHTTISDIIKKEEKLHEQN